METSNLCQTGREEGVGCDIKLVRGHRWMDSWHIIVSSGENVIVSLKHTFEQFQFILREQGASKGDLIYAM